VIEYSPSIHKALGSTPVLQKKKKKPTEKQNIQTFVHQSILSKEKRQSTECDKVIANHKYDKGLISRICK
jgi:hypothetical protein